MQVTVREIVPTNHYTDGCGLVTLTYERAAFPTPWRVRCPVLGYDRHFRAELVGPGNVAEMLALPFDA